MSGYSTNQVDVGNNLYEALKQFFTLHEDYRGNPFYLTGESYAGKYVPAIAYKIHKEGENAKKAGINLQGLAIGNGLCDPRNQINYGDFLYQISLIDEVQRAHFLVEQAKFVKLVDEGQFLKALDLVEGLLIGPHANTRQNLTMSYFTNISGLSNYFNFLLDEEQEEFNNLPKYLALKETRQALHVGNRVFNDGSKVWNHLENDIMQSVRPWIEELLNAGYRTLFYSGSLDIIVAAPLTENFFREMNWKGKTKYSLAPRKIYKVEPNDKTVAGYVKQADYFYYAIVRNSGHVVPHDAPRAALGLITKFVKNIEF